MDIFKRTPQATNRLLVEVIVSATLACSLVFVLAHTTGPSPIEQRLLKIDLVQTQSAGERTFA